MTIAIDSALSQATQYLLGHLPTPPPADAVVNALLQAEKTAKQQRHQPAQPTYTQLVGTWRLGFITGTKRTRQRAGVVMGAGRFLPHWIKIQIAYAQGSGDDHPNIAAETWGTTQNSVIFGALQLTLTGPTRFWPNRHILAFDFTRMTLQLAGLTLYSGYIRGGQQREVDFYQQSLKQQAFFSYFLVQPDCIAARGRGGGLAVWTRLESERTGLIKS